MPSTYWIKLYLEILEDPKMATLPDRLWRRVIEMFLCAGKLGGTGYLPETKQLAWILRMATDDLDLDLKQIATTGIIQQNGSGWFVTKFAQRQAPVPDAERKRQQRMNEKKSQYYAEDVTSPSRNVTQINRLTESESDSMSPNGDGRAKKGDLMDGILKYANRGAADLSEFPEDVREVIQVYCELYGQYPPRKSKKGEFGLWIADARELLIAGGAKTIPTLRDLKANPYKWMSDAMIAHPGALIKAVRARSAEIVNKKPSEMTDAEFLEHYKRLGEA